MNHDETCVLKTEDPQAAIPALASPDTVTPSLACSQAGLSQNPSTKLVRHSNRHEQINAAIDQWAESLVAIIEASDDPAGSLLRAHVAITIKHRELETMACQELATRGQVSDLAHG